MEKDKTRVFRVCVVVAALILGGIAMAAPVSVSLDCDELSPLATRPFTVRLLVSARALTISGGLYEPFVPDATLHIESEFLNFPEIKGLSGPDAQSALGAFAKNGSSARTYFTINKYVEQGIGSMMSFFSFPASPFEDRPVQFRVEPVLTNRSGTNYFDYALSFTYTPEIEGDYVFGPVLVTGKAIRSADASGQITAVDAVSLRAEAITVRVSPPPVAGRPDCYVGVVGKSLSIKAGFDAERCKVGDPLTLTVDVFGEVNVSAMRPPQLSGGHFAADTFRVYDDSIETLPIDNGKRFCYRVRPLKAGTLEFPQLSVAYYDPVRSKYVTVSSEPLPLQAEATTQIAATASGTDAESDVDIADSAYLRVNGIMMTPSRGLLEGISPSRFISLLILPPLAFAAVVLLSFIVSLVAILRRKTRRRRAFAVAFGELREAARLAEKSPREALELANCSMKAALAALFGRESASLTAHEICALLAERAIPEGSGERLGESFASLERALYSSEDSSSERARLLIDDVSESIKRLKPFFEGGRRSTHACHGLLALCLFLSALFLRSSLFAGVADRFTPPTFQWERAGSMMASSSSRADFLAAAGAYYEMVTNGASSGALFYNLGVALLAADKPHGAIEAFAEAESYLGLTSEIAFNWKVASAKITQGEGEGQLPISRSFLSWHYGVDLPSRIRIALYGWVSFFSVATIALLFKRFRRRRLSCAELAILRVLLTISASATLFYGITAAAVLKRRASFARDFPAIEHSLSPDREPQQETDEAKEAKE